MLHHDPFHYDDVIMTTMASQITSLTIVYSTVYSGADQRKHQSSASLAFVLGIHRGPVNSPHKWSITRKMFPFDDVIMFSLLLGVSSGCVRPITGQHRAGYFSNLACDWLSIVCAYSEQETETGLGFSEWTQAMDIRFQTSIPTPGYTK